METKTTEIAKTIKSTRQRRKQPEASHMSLPIAYENELHRLIQVSAYLLAEEDGFRQSPMHYWLTAEEHMELGL
jgi:hypothetical protein